MKQFIDQLTAWVTLAALLTGCATPGNTPAPVTRGAAGSTGATGVLDIIAALERDTAERRIPQAEGMVTVPAEMRSAIQGLLASPEGSGADNLKLRYAKPYMIDEEQAVLERAPAPRPYPPQPPLRRESGKKLNWSKGFWICFGISVPMLVSSVLFAIQEPKMITKSDGTRTMSNPQAISAFAGVLGAIMAGGGVWNLFRMYDAPLHGNIDRNRRVTREWEAQKREIDAENRADRSAVDARNQDRQAAVDARNRERQAVLDPINRYRGYIEVVDRENGTVRIIWPDLIPPEPRGAGQ